MAIPVTQRLSWCPVGQVLPSVVGPAGGGVQTKYANYVRWNAPGQTQIDQVLQYVEGRRRTLFAINLAKILLSILIIESGHQEL